jgi:hypothetical protein
MNRAYRFLLVVSIAMFAGCAAPTPTLPALIPTATPYQDPTIVAPSGYRPLQLGDQIEGTQISYQYVLPSLDQPAVDLAFGVNLLHLLSVKPGLIDNLVSFAKELTKESRTVYAFDENDPNQTEPKLLSIEPNKPLEVVFIFIEDVPHQWSVTETDQGEIRAGYKLVRRKDGGLRVINAYDTVTLHSVDFRTINGDGAGLVFASRLALLKVILNDPAYQRGENVMATKPPTLDQYDPRILKIDPTQQGMAQDQDWVLDSRGGPNPGLVAP